MAKNVFLFATIVFSLRFDDPNLIKNIIIAFFAFPLSLVVVTSSMMPEILKLINCIPRKKKYRPLASGAVPLRIAYIEMVVIFCIGMSLAYYVNTNLLWITATYFVTTMSYSLFFKNLLFLMSCLLLVVLWRVIAGAIAIDIKIFSLADHLYCFFGSFLGI